MAVIRLWKGDILAVDADAVVNAANSALWMGAGVAGAIKRRGGEEIEREAMAKGPIAIGEAVATGAGALKARYVIHAAAMGPNLITDEGKIAQATHSTLVLADELMLRSLVFPALGTGVGGFPASGCARIMIDEVVAHLQRGSGLEVVTFALFGTPAYDAFRADLFGRTLPEGITREE